MEWCEVAIALMVWRTLQAGCGCFGAGPSAAERNGVSRIAPSAPACPAPQPTPKGGPPSSARSFAAAGYCGANHNAGKKVLPHCVVPARMPSTMAASHDLPFPRKGGCGQLASGGDNTRRQRLHFTLLCIDCQAIFTDFFGSKESFSWTSGAAHSGPLQRTLLCTADRLLDVSKADIVGVQRCASRCSPRGILAGGTSRPGRWEISCFAF